MNLFLFNEKLAKDYKSKSQLVRVLTENWVLGNSYCPKCGHSPLEKFENNRPVADFECKKCSEEFELKSKKGELSKTVSDGAYSTMIKRISSNNNPNFFFLTYSKEWIVNNFIIIPKQFITKETIIKRPPLASTARRSGWVGCNIDISKVVETGKIYLIKQSKIIDPEIVKQEFNKILFLRDKTKETKGWIIDVLKCIDEIRSEIFTLNDVYKFEKELKLKHPRNNFIKDKIRQQLQVLRDNGIIEFIGRGKYKKIKYENI
ncbi:MAG: type-2 restriction enzyme DpnI [Bacteroidia bacterium]|nr:MAG: type-2 restriction enzyme DpnI [Bacteroidia bacterium]